MARIVRHMAEKTITSESLSQALHFLGERSAAGKIVRSVVEKHPSGQPKKVVLIELKGVKKCGSRKAINQTVSNTGKIFNLKPDVIDRLADKLDVAEVVILNVSGISERTFQRRQKQGEPLTTDEADRVLRIARVAGAAERVFGDAEKSRRWLARENALLGASPLSLLATDSGSRDVEAELMRIDWGDFA